MNLIDTHAHLYLDAFEKDREQCIQRARKAGVRGIYLPNIDKNSIEPLFDMVDSHPDFCHPMIGLHPCSVGEDWDGQLDLMEEMIETRSIRAIGEIGMDLYWDDTYREEQEKAFRRQVRWARDLGYPIVIHNREATRELLNLVREEQNGNLTGIFHCFTGTVEEGREMIDLNFYLGIGGILTFKNSDLHKTIRQLPLERIVLETDAPYLSPEPRRGKRNESAYLQYINKALAQSLNRSESEVANITSRNAHQVYSKL